MKAATESRYRTRCSQLLLVVGIGLAGGLGHPLASHAATQRSAPHGVISAQQIEADWLLQAELRFAKGGGSPTCEQDAAGACDGVIDGKWGFHTAHEPQPWWQIDLKQQHALRRLVIYNRCDSGTAARARHLTVLLGDQQENLAVVYRHDGTEFQGKSDGKPLVVMLDGRPARWLRLQVPETDYFHLDEVQVFADKDPQCNIALHCPATQSSTSQWSSSSAEPSTQWATVVATTLQRGLELAAAIRNQGIDTRSSEMQLQRVQQFVEQLPESETQAQWQAAYLQARWVIRGMMMKHPKLDFDSLLFVKRAPSQFPHLSDQYYGWWSRPGGGIYRLDDFKSQSPNVVCLTDSFAPGNFLRPDLHFDAGRVAFAYCKCYPHVGDLADKVTKSNLPEDAFYQLYEMNLDGSGLRQLTRGRYDDFDVRYLPDDGFLFLSTRKGTFLQCDAENSALTLHADLPDSYVRCGGGNSRPVPVFTLHAIDKDGGNIRPLSAFETFEYTPSLTSDGRILYCRWDYIDRFNGHFFSLWSTNQDGTGTQLVYGNYTKRPQATMEPREIPGTDQILFTAAAHHSITGGSLVLLDRSYGTEGDAPITRLTPEVPFPETERNIGHYFANPYPLSEDLYLVSWATHTLPAHSRLNDERNPVNAQGIYLLDRWGNLELLYRDPEISSMTPLPIRRRLRPLTHTKLAEKDSPRAGSFLLQDVYAGLTGIEQGSVRRLRIVGVPPKVQPHMNQPSLGVSHEETGKYVLGTVPVEEDGSAHFQIPSGVPVFFQALDGQGRSLQTMRSLTYVQPGETLACVGCHESRESAPVRDAMPLAAQRAPSLLQPGPEGSWPLRFDQLVQVVLDQHCVRCHRPQEEATLDLVGADGVNCPPASPDLTAHCAHASLLQYAEGDLSKLVFEKDYSQVGDSPSLQSRLLAYLQQDTLHCQVPLSDDDWQRLYTWMDTYGHTQGSFSEQQEHELTAFRQQCRWLFTSDTGSE